MSERVTIIVERGLSLDKYKDELTRWSSNKVFVNTYPPKADPGIVLIEDGGAIDWSYGDIILAVGKVNPGDHKLTLPPIPANLGPNAVIEAIEAAEPPQEPEADEEAAEDSEGPSQQNT
jgi:hypothetical protein